MNNEKTFEQMMGFYATLRRAYVNAFTRRFREETLSPNELDILLFLANNPSINTAGQLKTCLNVSKALICRSVDSLAEKSLLVCEPDEQDKRVQHLLLTKHAEPLIAKIQSIKDDLANELLAGISPEDVFVMLRTLDQIAERFHQLAEQTP